MHKINKRPGHARQLRQGRKIAERKRLWSKFLVPATAIVGIVVAAAALTTRVRSDPAPATEIPVKPAEPSIEDIIANLSKNNLVVALPNDRYHAIPLDEIEQIIWTSCCTLVVLTKESTAIGEIEKKMDVTEVSGRGLTVGVVTEIGSDSSESFGLALVKHPDAIEEDSQEVWCEYFTRETRKKIARAATRGNLKTRKRLLERIKREAPLDQSKSTVHEYGLIQASSGQQQADWFIEHVATVCMVTEIVSRQGDHLEQLAFLNTLVHEATHAAQAKYKVAHRLDHLLNVWEVNETFGTLSEIAYGENVWIGLDSILGKYYPMEIEGLERFGEFKSAQDLQRIARTSKFFAGILGRLLGKMGMEHLVEVLDADEKQLRRAARAILDEESMKHYGMPFAQVVPLGELKQILKDGRQYLAETR